MITKIRLKNFKSHESTEMEFGEGINVIVGRMGAGKSSILDAISLALFGTFPDLQSRKVGLDDVIMSRGKVKNRAEVEVHFSIGDRNFSAKRVVERGKGITYAELREDGNLIISPQTKKVTSEIENIIGMDYDTFSRAVYGEQNNIDLFLRMGRGERKKRLDELMGLDKYDRARENCVKLMNKIKSEIDVKKSELSRIDKRRMEMERVEAEKRMEELEKERDSLVKRLLKLKAEKDKLVEEFKEMERISKEISSLSERIRLRKQTLKEIISRMESIKGLVIENASEKVQELEPLVDGKRKERERLLESARMLEMDIAEREKRIAMMEREIKENKRISEEIESLKKSLPESVDLEGLKKQRDRLIENLSKTRQEMEEIEKAMEELSRAEGKCPVCQSPLGEEKKRILINHYSKRMEKLREEMERLRNEIGKVNKELKEGERREMERREILARISQLEKSFKEVDETLLERERETISKAKKELSEIGSRLEEVSKEIERLEAELREMRKAAEMERKMIELSAERKSLEKALEEEKTKLERLEKRFDHERYESLRKRLSDMEGEIGRVSGRVESIGRIVEEISKTLKYIKGEIERYERLEREIGFLEFAYKFLDEYKAGLLERQRKARERKVERINDFMDSIWDSLYPYGDFSSARLNVTENDYILELFDGEKWVKVDGIASGGERTIASLAMRIAISLLMTKQLRFIFLDEPTHNLDETAIKMFSEVLRTKITDFVNQVIVITHDELMEEAATSHFYRIEKKGVISSVSSEYV